MERVGLVSGWFNVREARAEPGTDGKTVEVIAGGRALSWRWLRRPEAHRLLDERLGTLEAMGYKVVDSQMATRGRWDWLYDLVHRRLARAEAGGLDPEASAPDRPEPSRGRRRSDCAPADPLRDALSRLGLSPDAILDGVASVLGLTPHAVSEPEARTVRRTDPDHLAVLLPFLIHHEHPEVRAIGARWLACRAVSYQLSPKVLVQWLESDARVSAALAPRLRAEGLAMLGPDALLRLSRTGHPTVRDAARAWSHRILG
jgi:hypothetical protein